MRSTGLTREQAWRLRVALARRLRWLIAVRRRMEALGMTPEHRLFSAMLKAEHAVQELTVMAHYASCATDGNVNWRATKGE